MGSNLIEKFDFDNKSELINNSIRCLLDCIRSVETMRSSSSMENLSEEDVAKILGGVKNLEKNIERLNNKLVNKSNRNIYKAIGKNKTLWVARPDKKIDSNLEKLFNTDLNIKTFSKTYAIKDLYSDVT